MSTLLKTSLDGQVELHSFYSGEMHAKCYQLNNGANWFHFVKEQDALEAFDLIDKFNHQIKLTSFKKGE